MEATQQTELLQSPGGNRPMTYDVRLATRITSAVDRRLRMLALARSQPLSHVLTGLLDQALPSADELAVALASDEIPNEAAA
jgi:hypothetical protein